AGRRTRPHRRTAAAAAAGPARPAGLRGPAPADIHCLTARSCPARSCLAHRWSRPPVPTMEAMTERKPVEHTFESWVDKQIREATERGEFENLAGAGKPIPGAGAPVDENWWIRGYLRRQGVPADGLLPDSLVLRRDRQRLAETVAGDCDSEAEVRAEVAAL